MRAPVEHQVLIRSATVCLYASPWELVIGITPLRYNHQPSVSAGGQLGVFTKCSDVWTICGGLNQRWPPSILTSLFYIPHFYQSPSSLRVWMAPPHCQPLRDGCFPYRPDQDRRFAPGGPEDVKPLTRPVNLRRPISTARSACSNENANEAWGWTFLRPFSPTNPRVLVRDNTFCCPSFSD